MANRYRSAILWVLLIALFLGVYWAFNHGAGGRSSPADNAPLASALANYLPLVFLALFVFFFLRQLRSPGRRTNQEGIELLNRGRILQALQKFELAATQLGNSAGIAYFNVGVARLNLWQLEAAVAAFEQAQQVKVKVPAPAFLALAHALLGDREVAERLVREATPESAGVTNLVRAVLEARASNLPRAFELASAVEVKQLGGMNRALAETLRAWAQHQQGARWPVDRIALFGEADAGGLQRAWPELAAFVEQAPS